MSSPTIAEPMPVLSPAVDSTPDDAVTSPISTPAPAVDSMNAAVPNGDSRIKPKLLVASSSHQDQIVKENQSMKQSLSMCIEFKRLLEHMFRNQKIERMGILNEYKHHYTETFRKYQAYRRAFSNSLAGCRLPGCNEFASNRAFMNGDSHSGEDIDNNDIVNGHADDLGEGLSAARPVVNTVGRNINNKRPLEEDAPVPVRAAEPAQPRPEPSIAPSTATSSAPSIASSSASSTASSTAPSTSSVGETNLKPVTAPDPSPTSLPSGPIITPQLKRPRPPIKTEPTRESTTIVTTPTARVSATPSSTSSGARVSFSGRPTVSVGGQQYPAGGSSVSQETKQPKHPPVRVKEEIEAGEHAIPIDPNAASAPKTRIEVARGKDGKIRCKVQDCTRTFEVPSEANEHYKTHSKLFKCSVCNKLFSSKTLVFRHFTEHNPPPKPAGESDGADAAAGSDAQQSDATSVDAVSADVPLDAPAIPPSVDHEEEVAIPENISADDSVATSDAPATSE